MGLWCKDLPFVTVERSTVPKPVTLIVPYYEAPEFLLRQFNHWCVLASTGLESSAHIAKYVSIILVDDGSPQYPARAALGPRLNKWNTWLKLFEIKQDVPWNWLAARNIGAHEASDGWLLMTDMDHVVNSETMEACIYGVHRTDTIYGFSRIEHTGKPAQPHANSFFLTREMYWKWGGYDETLSGHYGTNGDAYRRMWQTAPMAILRDRLVRHEFVADASTTQFTRKLPEDAAAVRKLVAARRPGWRPKVLSFPYAEVTPRAMTEVA